MPPSLPVLKQSLANLEKAYHHKPYDDKYVYAKSKLEQEIALHSNTTTTGGRNHAISGQEKHNKRTAKIEGKAWAYDPFKNMPVTTPGLQKRTRFKILIEWLNAVITLFFSSFWAFIIAILWVGIFGIIVYFILQLLVHLKDTKINFEFLKGINSVEEIPIWFSLSVGICFLYLFYSFLEPDIDHFREKHGRLKLSNTGKAVSILRKCFDNSHLVELIDKNNTLNYRTTLIRRQSQVFKAFSISALPDFISDNVYFNISADDIYKGILRLCYENRDELQIGCFLEEKGQDPAALYIINLVIRAGNAEYGIHIAGCKIIAEDIAGGVHMTLSPFFATSGRYLNSQYGNSDEPYYMKERQKLEEAKANLDASAIRFSKKLWHEIDYVKPWKK